MKKQDELSNPNSCLNKAADDEPLFVLRGKDPAAAIAICAWIEERIALGKNIRGDDQMRDAMELVVEMEQYSNNAVNSPHAKTLPDSPT